MSTYKTCQINTASKWLRLKADQAIVEPFKKEVIDKPSVLMISKRNIRLSRNKVKYIAKLRV